MRKLTPMRAIREKCLDCSCYQPLEVRLCTAEKCPLFPYRMGKRPRQGNYTTDESYSKKTVPTTAENEKGGILS